jgi:hypothetical protein
VAEPEHDLQGIEQTWQTPLLLNFPAGQVVRQVLPSSSNDELHVKQLDEEAEQVAQVSSQAKHWLLELYFPGEHEETH